MKINKNWVWGIIFWFSILLFVFTLGWLGYAWLDNWKYELTFFGKWSVYWRQWCLMIISFIIFRISLTKV